MTSPERPEDAPENFDSESTLRQREFARVGRVLRAEVGGGVILAVAALLGFIVANSPLVGVYEQVRDFRIGPEIFHLNLTIGEWASDGLLAIFFFLVGLELKREFVAGDLRSPKAAIVPVAAAIGGVAVPALIYLAFTQGTPYTHGWAIPAATDIAFAVAVLGLIAPRIPAALRMFLLTLAVVDDLIAIAIIAIGYTSELNWIPLALALIPFILYAWLVRQFGPWFERSTLGPWLVLFPVGVVVWAFVHASGIHATVAGVALAFAVPVIGKYGQHTADVFEHRFRPLSTGVAVPVFAFFAAGVAISGDNRFPVDPIAFGIIVGLVLGKPIGILLTTWLLERFTSAELAGNQSFRDIAGVGALAGIGFTVSLLIADLSFTNSEDSNTARLAVIAASLIAIVLASILLIYKRPRTEPEVLATLGPEDD